MTGTNQFTKPSFGFGDLDDIQPGRVESSDSERPSLRREPPAKPLDPLSGSSSADTRASSNSRASDEAAARLGFGSRENLVRRRKRQPIEEPVEQINLRAAVADINVFIEWCEKKRYSYREGFAELVKHINNA